VAKKTPAKDAPGPEFFGWTDLAAEIRMSFPRIAFCAGVVTALSVLVSQLTEGAVPCPKRFTFNPARPLPLPVAALVT